MVNLMGTKLGERLKKAQRLNDRDAWVESFDRHVKNLILNWIKFNQLKSRGIDETGDVIGWYSELTEILSGGLKKFNTPYTLYDTGEFYNSMTVTADRDSFTIDADGLKEGTHGTENLFTKYGDGIIGLTDENLERLIVIIRSKYIIHARKKLGIY